MSGSVYVGIPGKCDSITVVVFISDLLYLIKTFERDLPSSLHLLSSHTHVHLCTCSTYSTCVHVCCYAYLHIRCRPTLSMIKKLGTAKVVPS